MASQASLDQGAWPTLRERPSRARGRDISLAGIGVGAAAVVLSLHALVFADWLIDDAGISFAYARSLALGHGLVSQPGALPVEGFSNPLWTLLIAGLFPIGLFDPEWTPKLLGLALSFATFWVIAGDSCRSRNQWAALLAPLWLGLDTSFVVWTQSGLENALLALLAASACAITRRTLEPGAWSAWDLAAGAIGGFVALTRPDAIVLASAYPLCHLAALRLERRSVRETAARLMRHLVALGTIVFSYALFRWSYFHDLVPNTYHAKEKPSLTSLLDLEKLVGILSATLGPLGIVLVIGGIVASWPFDADRGVGTRRVTVRVFLALALATYLVMPTDWMGEYRFATAAIVFVYWSLAELAGDAWEAASRTLRVVLAVSVAAFSAESALRHATRSADFASKPPAPFKSVAAFAGDGYNQLAEALGTDGASLLTPDVGGAFYHSKLRVHDLVGLCDATIARTLTRDTAAFHRYVFERVRPTFIHVHGAWAGWASLHATPAFARDYVPLFEDWRPHAEGSRSPGEPRQGDYVRRDALSPGDLERLRQLFVASGMAAATF